MIEVPGITSLRHDPRSGYVFVNPRHQTIVLELGAPSQAERYSLAARLDPVFATSALQPFEGVSVVIPKDAPAWESWLPELDFRADLTSSGNRSEVSRQIGEVQRITGLNDTRLARAFPSGVRRETVTRWRKGQSKNLRRENLYRLGLLCELAKRMQQAGIQARLWLHQPIEGSRETPYELMCAGRLADVRQAVDSILAGLAPPTSPMRAVVTTHRTWDVVAEDECEDDAEWNWSTSPGDIDE